MRTSDHGHERTLRLSHFTIETAPDVVVWSDAEGRIHRINQAIRRYGYTPEEFIGKKLYELFPAMKEKAFRERWKVFREKKVLVMEKMLPTGDGRLVPVEVTANLIEFEGREYTCIFVHDVSDRKQAEAELKQALEEVESLKNRLQEENIYLQQEIKLTHNFDAIITRNARFKETLAQVEQVASTDATVLILGETGTGKELIARAVHNISARRQRPLVKVNCAALPASLIESELFGHEKGAFTGALARKIGRFELADGGTIFLDEIGDLPPELQVKLLRVLQDGEFERLGNPNSIKVDVRVIAATNRDLEQALQSGSFREDLYYRLSVFPIHLPPLRERPGDIPLLVNHFVMKYAAKVGKKIEALPRREIDALANYHWPGNVRELENVIERAVILSPGRRLELGQWHFQPHGEPGNAPLDTLEEAERAHILKALEMTRWRVSGEKGAAKILAINPQTLVSRMKKLGIRR